MCQCKYIRKTLKYFVLTLLVYGGCSQEESIHVKDETNGLCVLFEIPALISMAMMVYRQSEGAWPTSIRDLELLFDGEGAHLFGVNWAGVADIILLQELPDGRLKIISKDSEFPFTTIVDVPKGAKVDYKGH